jgi:O-antigen/teichoic acid export membrane protein
MKLLGGRVDLLVVAAVLPAGDVGLYAVAAGFRELGMAPLRSYSAILQNMLVDRNRDGRDDRTLVIGSLLLQAALSALLTLGAVLVFPTGVRWLYGPDFGRAALPAAMLFGSASFLSVAGLCWAVFHMDGRPGLTGLIMTLTGLTGPLVVWTLARSAGLGGAAAAGALNALLVCVVSLAVLARVRGYSRRDVGTVVRRLPSLVRDLRPGVLAGVGPSAAGPSGRGT